MIDESQKQRAGAGIARAESDASQPDEVSVVVPTLDEEQTIVRLLAALEAQTHAPAEIVVADGGSTDRTRELVREFQTRSAVPVVLAGSERGLPGGNRNLGIVRASHDWVALVDAGTVPRPDWLEKLLGAARRDASALVVFGQYEALAESFFTRCAAVTYTPAPGEPVRSTASCLLRRAAWERAGRFREDLRSAEDLLFFRALDAAGVRSTHAPDALVSWELRPTLASTFRKFTVYARNNMRAGLAREWQRGVARFYALVAASVVAGFFFRPFWLAAPLLLLLRASRRVWRWHARKPGASRAAALFNVPRLLMVTWLNFVIDAATFYGTFQWFVHDHVGVPEEK
ncbi:MAG TPA: glycosyltransferase [Pyrinomonadaceae bacterium]|nr:glycosyltransferase [Pyrinomonadaceae bacterium]